MNKFFSVILMTVVLSANAQAADSMKEVCQDLFQERVELKEKLLKYVEKTHEHDGGGWIATKLQDRRIRKIAEFKNKLAETPAIDMEFCRPYLKLSSLWDEVEVDYKLTYYGIDTK